MKTDLVFCFLSCLVKIPAREANSWRKRASSNPGNWVCVFFSFCSSYRFSIFSRSNAHTHTNKEGAKTRGKAERRQRAVRFTRFLDYRLMSDSGLSFSLKYDLIRPPSLINTYIFSGSFSCSVCFRLFRLVLSVTRDERRLNIGEYTFLQQQHHSRNDGSRRKKFVMNQAKRRTNWEAIVAEGEGEQSCLIFYMY